MAHWASGVTVVTTRLQDETVGITVSSFSSVSLAPPQILVCIAKKLHTHAVVEQSRVFAVNVLGVEHLELGMRFAGMFPEITDRFAGLGCFSAETGCPILPGVLG
ncbi:MAG: flavin reductase family protein [Caldilineaceae bacterium]|nr:flavin reductase family protein [Caldilineaceae bacterium]